VSSLELRLKFNSDHQAKSTYGLQHFRRSLLNSLPFTQKKIAYLARVLSQLIALDHFQDFKRDCASQRCAAKCARVGSRRKQVGEFFADPKRAHRKSAA